jgi:hypothetical protein
VAVDNPHGQQADHPHPGARCRAPAAGDLRAAPRRLERPPTHEESVLLLTGAINAWYLAGSIHALTATDYGHLLLVPVLTDGRPSDALRKLRRNMLIEIAAAALIMAVVAVLGVTPPGLGE